MADEGFREIQLGKKQLFFAFMALALYSVVVYSLGVWTGQSVHRPESEIAAETAPDTPADSTPEPTKVAPNELDYGARLGDGKTPAAGAATTPAKPVEPPSPPDTEVAVATPPPAQKAPEAKAPATTKPAPAPAEKPAAKTPPPPVMKSGMTLQVGAFNDSATAQSLAKKLKAKGYAAFVFDAPSGPLPHKVRVGPLADRAEADKVSARLKKEEGFSPFITR